MSISRRRFMGLAASTGCWAVPGGSFGDSPQVANAFEEGLQAWMEVLLPADEMSPGAGALNVHLEIIRKAESIDRYLPLLQAGIRWVDLEARSRGAKRFAELNVDASEAIVSKAEQADITSAPGAFFHLTLRDGVDFYYAHKESWQGVGFPHPPQPLGFHDYHEAPK